MRNATTNPAKTASVLTHPAFDREPVRNVLHPGRRPKAIVSLRAARQIKRMQVLRDERAARGREVTTSVRININRAGEYRDGQFSIDPQHAGDLISLFRSLQHKLHEEHIAPKQFNTGVNHV
ncbi:hypothetical protein [Caballeronia sordidicola]|uniref:hypothetical protein n=1 Tax=Caballeronia sordidicola TaxID=196367 RepID=UPI00117C7F6E|nr:hypothetical protein [Caballeronia sordidicola]